MGLPRAVSSSGDGDAGPDAAPTREGGGVVLPNLGVAAGGVLGALAGCAPVRRGASHRLKVPEAATASWGRSAAAGEERDTRPHGLAHVGAGNGEGWLGQEADHG